MNEKVVQSKERIEAMEYNGGNEAEQGAVSRSNQAQSVCACAHLMKRNETLQSTDAALIGPNYYTLQLNYVIPPLWC